MAAQTISGVINYDSPSMSGLLNGETVTVQGADFTINADVRWGQNSAVFGAIAFTTLFKNKMTITAENTWEIPFGGGSSNYVDSKLMIGFDAGTFVDESPNPKTLTSPVMPTIVDASSIGFGTKRSSFTGGAYLDINHTGTDLDLGSSDFILFFEIETGITEANKSVITIASPPSGFAALRITLQFGQFLIQSSSDGTTYAINRLCSASIVANQPTIVKLVRTGNNWYFYLNSTLADTWTSSISLYPYQIGGVHRLGSADPSFYFTGFLDEIVLIKGSSVLTGGANLVADRYFKWSRTPFVASASTGLVPALGNLGTNAVTGQTSGATGELICVMRNDTYLGNFARSTPGSVMPTNGFIKLRTKTGTFIPGETITLPGGATIVALTAGVRSWINVVGRESTVMSVPKATKLFIKGDWYQIGVTDGKANQTFNMPVADTAPGIYVETSPSSNVFEWWFCGGARWGTATQFIPTDTRGKYFGVDPASGLIRIAKRSTSINCGFMPAAGCRVYIGNVILSSAASTNYNLNTQSATNSVRYNISTTNNGNLDIRNCTSNWASTFTNPYSVSIINTSMFYVSISNAVLKPYLENVCVGISGSVDQTAIGVTSTYSGSTLKNCYATRYLGSTSGAYTCSLSDAVQNITVDGGVFHIFGNTTDANRGVTNISPLSIQRVKDVTINNPKIAGGRAILSIASNVCWNGLQYADLVMGDTTAINPTSAVDITNKSEDIEIYGYSSYDNLPNINPYGGLFNVSAFSYKITLGEIGSMAIPFDFGTNPNRTGAVLTGNLADTIVLKNVFTKNSRLAPFTSSSTFTNVELRNVWGEPGVTQTFVSSDTIVKGGRWTRTTAAQSAVYGKHFEDYVMTSDTAKYLNIAFNEPSDKTLNQVSVYGYEQEIAYPRLSRFLKSSTITLSEDRLSVVSGIGYSICDTSVVASAGTVWDWEVTITNITDTAAVGIGRSTSTIVGQNSGCVGYLSTGELLSQGSVIAYGAPYVAGDVIGVILNTTTNTVEFKKNGVSQGVALTGLTGTYYPMLGGSAYTAAYSSNFGQSNRAYAVQGGATKDYGNPPAFFTGAGAIIMANLSDELIMEMDYFMLGATSMSSSDLTRHGTNTGNHYVEFQYDLGTGYNGTWLVFNSANQLSVPAIDINIGIKLKIRIGVTVASLTNQLNYLLIYFNSTTQSIAVKYPDPVVLISGKITNMTAGSRLRIYNTTTSTELFNEAVTGTSYDYYYAEGSGITTGDVIDIRVTSFSGSTCKLPFATTSVASATGWSAFISQQNDDIYTLINEDGSAMAEFSMDTVNNFIKINDPDKHTTAQRLYAWTAYYRNTSTGITGMFNSFEAIDFLNYRRNPSVSAWNLYNELLSVVRVSGAYVYSSDDSNFIADSIAGVSGSIFMDARRAYGVEVGTSGLTPDESDLLNEISTLAKESSVQTAIKAAKAAQALSLL